LDYATAEKISLALLTRAAFGTDAGLRAAARLNVQVELIKSVFGRHLIDTRIDIVGAAPSFDRRRERPANEIG
jgi:hypothetical protein